MRPYRHIALFGVIVLVCALSWQGLRQQTGRVMTGAASAPRLEPVRVDRSRIAAQTPAASSVVHGPNTIEICGVGWVDKDVPDMESVIRSEGQFRKGRNELADRLKADPDKFAQAVGTFVQMWGDFEDRYPPEGENSLAACQNADCPAAAAREQAFSSYSDQVARSALTSTDPRLYAFAFKACQQPRQPDSCSELNARQWARLDPNNAVPWVYILDQATKAQDVAATDDALFHIANSKQDENRSFAAAGEISSHASTDNGSAISSYAAAVEVLGFTAAQWVPVQTLMQACRGAALDDANRRQVCEKAAETLASRSDTLLMSAMGAAMGRRLGWPADRTDAVHGLQQAILESTIAEDVSGERAYSCESLWIQLRRFSRQAEIGEIGQAREWVAASGQSQSSFTAKAREMRLNAEKNEVLRRSEAASAGTPQ